ncbi:Ribosomal protein S3Ae [mine drainage metagenome]|uniref:Ribosomal protein S3Ae n=1 Tax=mine drainage metagenome TaxID=410659 RepID=T0YHI3_9ZZZZ
MATTKGSDKWKLKKWFSAYAPKPFNDVLIAELPANDEKTLLGRNIHIGLDRLTNNPQNSFANVIFKITEANGDRAQLQLVRIELLFSYVRSLARRYRSLADSMLKVTTKDNRLLVMKPLIVTAGRETHARIVGIRKEMNQYLEQYAKENDTDTIVSEVVSGKLQSDMYAKLKHITQLNRVEMKKLELKQ